MRRLPDSVKDELIQQLPLIAPSVLAADFANLEQEIRRAEAAGARLFHLDVMDGHFVPNISFGVPVVASIRKVTELPLAAHLMISDPARYLNAFVDAGADAILFHIETVPDPRELIQRIRSLGVVPGLAFNPETPVEAVASYVCDVDVVLSMSVQPGFGGQRFKPEVLEKVRQIRKMARPGTLLSIDGGIGTATIKDAAQAGIDIFVAGTSVFGADNYSERMKQLRALASEGRGIWESENNGSVGSAPIT